MATSKMINGIRRPMFTIQPRTALTALWGNKPLLWISWHQVRRGNTYYVGKRRGNQAHNNGVPKFPAPEAPHTGRRTSASIHDYNLFSSNLRATSLCGFAKISSVLPSSTILPHRLPLRCRRISSATASEWVMSTMVYSIFSLMSFQQLQDGMRSHGVKCAGGLVAQHDGRVVHQGSAQSQHAAADRQKADWDTCRTCRPSLPVPAVHERAFRLLLVGMAELKRKHDIAKNRTLLKQTEVLEDHAYRAAELAQFLFGKTRDIAPIDDDRAK